jgi:hypothetical protein
MTVVRAQWAQQPAQMQLQQCIPVEQVAPIIVVQKGCAQIEEANAIIFECPVQKLSIWGTIAGNSFFKNAKHVVIKLLKHFFVTEQFELGWADP